MRFTNFIIELEKAGWQAVSDAQHKNIECLHRMLFPVIAELENENVELAEQIIEHNRG